MTLPSHLSVQNHWIKPTPGLPRNRPAEPPALTLFSQMYAHWVSRPSNESNDRATGLKAPDYRVNCVRSQVPSSYRGPIPQLKPRRVSGNETSPSASATQPVAADTGGETIETSSIQAAVERAARRYNLPATLINAVIQAESNFQAGAVSPAGAQGLMQLMPGTAEELGVTDPFDIEQNIDGGARYLRKMLNRFDGNLKLALAAYNAGPGTVQKYGGQVPYAETKKYVRRVLQLTEQSV